MPDPESEAGDVPFLAPLEAQDGSGIPLDEEDWSLIERLSALTSVSLSLGTHTDDAAEGAVACEVSISDDPTGWIVGADGDTPKHHEAARMAAAMLSNQMAARLASSSDEVALEDKRLEFLYRTSQRLGALLTEDEISDLVIGRAAELLACERASLMIYDSESRSLKIRASRGLDESIARQTIVRPGERISGKVFQTGREVFIDADDAMPSNSLGLDGVANPHSFISVPLEVPALDSEDKVILGVMNLTGKAGGLFTPLDLKVVQTLAAHTAAQLQNCRLLDAERARRRLEEELSIAAGIQLRLLPKEPVEADGMVVTGLCRTATHCGGDFFDYWRREDGHVCLAVADVCGHDLSAALLATSFRSVLRTESAHGASVAERVANMARSVYADLANSELLITACYAEFDPATRTLTHCSCGHPPPLVLRDGKPAWLRDGGGLLLGIDPDMPYEQATYVLKPGDLVFLYTDGLTEAGETVGDQFGEDRLAAAVAAAGDQDLDVVLQHVLDAVEAHAGEAAMHDDITMLLARLCA